MVGINLYEAVKAGLEEDEVLLMVENYVDNWMLYDQINDIGYLVRDYNDSSEGRLDFVWRRNLEKWVEERDTRFVQILDKVIVARVRLPWNKVDTEWIVSEAQLEEYRDDVEILEIYLRARRRNEPEGSERLILDHEARRMYEANPDDYIVTEKKYLVAWKISPETRERLLQIVPSRW